MKKIPTSITYLTVLIAMLLAIYPCVAYL